MIDKKRLKVIQDIQERENEYWLGISINDIITIRTKAIDGPYVQRPAEEFTAIRVPQRELPGFEQTLRCIPLQGDKVVFRHVPLAWIESINGKSYAPQTEWEVAGSKGNKYKVKLIGNKYTCTCPGYTYRKKCKHSEEIKNQNA
ncbi:MAG: hypothetical protein JSV32_06440 [Dehalococcoidia bacterium]|nr:MAG: hypothetical protein JSV32_06440 [Dehalococcoidia bacterium]